MTISRARLLAPAGPEPEELQATAARLRPWRARRSPHRLFEVAGAGRWFVEGEYD